MRTVLFGEGPFEMHVADLFAGTTVSLSCRLLGALDQPGIGNKVLDRGKAIDVVDLVEDDQGKLLPTSNVSESLKGRSSARKFLALAAAPV